MSIIFGGGKKRQNNFFFFLLGFCLVKHLLNEDFLKEIGAKYNQLEGSEGSIVPQGSKGNLSF